MKTDENNGKVSRRGFLKAAGGVTFAVTAYALLPKMPFLDAEASGEFVEKKLSAWVRIAVDGKITIYNPSAEMGQGSMTALPLILAEEMDANWDDVAIEQSPVEPDTYGSYGFGGRPRMITVGSRSVMSYFESLRQAGAQVRQILLLSAAKKLKVSAEELTTGPSVVIHKASGRKLSYGEIAEFVEIPEVAPNVTTELKRIEDFRLIGNKNIPRFDIPAKTDGSAMYAIDVRLPGMVYALISRAPVHGAAPKLINKDAVLGLKGMVGAVELDHGIAVIAETIEDALAAKLELSIEWTGGTAAGHNSEADCDKYASIAADPKSTGRRMESNGDAAEAFKNAHRTYTADYRNDHAYHAQMEPLNAVVSVASDGNTAEVWAGSQAPDGARSAAARALGIERSRVKFNQMYLGGGFGRRSNSDYVEEAAKLAKAVKRPVKLIWTREDDVTYGQFRPMSLQRMQAGVDAKGNVTSWMHTIVGTGRGLLTSGVKTPFYSVPNQHIERRDVEHGIRTKHWRAVGHGPNKFAIEAFVDEIAAGENTDPYQFRRRLMTKFPRALNVLDAAAKMADWDAKPKPGRAKGIAFAERSGSLCAGVCEISVGEGGIRVHRVWVALDAGIVIQPDNVIAQTEGNIIMALSNVLYEGVTIRDGKVQESNFDGYRLARMEDTPELIDIKIIPSNERPTGVGEAALPFVGGAIANAFAALTGKRIRHMPFTPAKVRKLLDETTRAS